MIEHFVSIVTDAAANHWVLAYTVVGFMAAAEALPVLGTVVPGSAVIVAISALAPSGGLRIWPLIIVSILGAVFADGSSFWLGRHFERNLVSIWPMRRYPQLIARAEALFRRHGGKSVLLARFIQGPRAFVPLVAGMSGMQPGRFYAFNIASALVWAPSHVLAGVAIGASLHAVAAIAGRLALFLVLVAVLVWMAVWVGRRVILGLASPAFGALQDKLARGASAEDSWARRQLAGLFNAERRETGVLVLGGALLVGSLWLFLGILEDILTGDPLVRANTAVFHFLQSIRTTWGDRLMVAATEMGDSAVTTTVTAAVLGWLLWRRCWQGAAYWLAAVGGAAIFTPIIKFAVHWPRPVGLYSGWEAFSFPSGHATVNAVLYGFLVFLVARELRLKWRVWVVAGVCTLVALIGFSRLYLGAHWLADVVAGVCIGTAWVVLLAMSYIRHRPQQVGALGLLGIAMFSVVAAWSWHLHQQFTSDLTRYARQTEVRRMARSDWRSTGYLQLPARRVDLGGETEEPLTLQWAGSLSALRSKLVQAGWRPSASWSLDTTARWLSGGATPLELPVLPKLHDGRAPDLRLIHPLSSGERDAAARLVLLTWSTNVVLRGDATEKVGTPLWLGAVFEQRIHHPLGLFTVANETTSVNSARDVLAHAFPNAIAVSRAGGEYASCDGGLILAAGTQ